MKENIIQTTWRNSVIVAQSLHDLQIGNQQSILIKGSDDHIVGTNFKHVAFMKLEYERLRKKLGASYGLALCLSPLILAINNRLIRKA